MKARLTGSICAGLALAFLAAGARAESPDAWITTKAKIALLTADNVSVSAVNVDTKNGVVTMHGKVKSQAEKDNAAAAVKSVDGVKKVENLLQVVPDAFKDRVDAKDDTIKDNAHNALKADPSLKDVKVSAVDNGVVLLSGKTDSLNQKLRAIETVMKVPGVRKVAANEVTTDETKR
jgi:hyperosmotically inducible periplasmic protein